MSDPYNLEDLLHRIPDPVLREELGRYLERLSVRDRFSLDSVEEYIRSLEWSEDSTNREITLVAGNLRAFASWIRGEWEFERSSDAENPGKRSKKASDG